MQIQKNLCLIQQVSPFKNVGDGQRYIIQKNLNALLNLVLQNATEFQSSNLNKLKALQQLKQIACIADISEHLTLIFKALSKIFVADDNYYQKEIRQICYIIGLKINADYYLPTLINIIQIELQNQQSRNIANLLHMLSETIQHENDSLEIDSIVHIMLDVEKIFTDSSEVMDGIFQLIQQIVIISQNNLTIYVRQLFQLILTIKSYQQNTQINKTLELLAQKCGYSSVVDLHTNEVNILLDEICQKQQYLHWKHNSRDFYKFKAIIQGCGDGIAKFMNQIIQIMKHCLQPEQEIELRLETLLLLDIVVQIKSIQSTIQLFAFVIFSQLILPSMIWKVGKPNIKTRKAAVIIAIQLIDLLSTDEINAIFSALTAPLKSCLTDDWAPDVRFASSRLTTKLMKHQLQYDHLSGFYASLLERLDDSQNPIRIEISLAIGNVFQQQKLQQGSIIEYIIKGVLIHLDDSSEEVQRAIYECLLRCQNREQLLRECEGSVKNFKYPRLCNELIKHCKEQQ